VCVFFLFSQGGQLVGPMPVLAACHLIYICSIVLHYIAIHVVANKVLSLLYNNRIQKAAWIVELCFVTTGRSFRMVRERCG